MARASHPTGRRGAVRRRCRPVPDGRCGGGSHRPLLAAPEAAASTRRSLVSHPDLTAEEQRGVEHGAWFGKLSAPLRADILARAQVRRLPDGGLVSVRGATADEWCGVAKGAVRIGSVSLAGKPITLTYAEPGTWFGDVALFDGLPRTHDASAHGETTLLIVGRTDFRVLLEGHVELYDALLRLQCRRLRLMFDMVEDLNTLPLAARLAKQLLLLARGYGIAEGTEVRIGLQLAQEDLAQLLGASRQRVNQELKTLERDGALRVEPTRLVLLSRDKLLAIAQR